jgi:endonuclease/exonuclease/phosphatase family metal-dependent hydrolase
VNEAPDIVAHAPSPGDWNEDSDIEIGGAVTRPGNQSVAGPIVVASFNIRYAVGSFLISGSLCRRAGLAWPSRRSALVRSNIAKAARLFQSNELLPAPDILALQEADVQTVRAGHQHIARELAVQLGMSYAHGPAGIPRGSEPRNKQWYLDFEEHIGIDDNGDTGIAILSRLAMIDLRRVELPWTECPWRPRLALAATFSFGGARLLVVNAHIDPHASVKEQGDQHRAILAHAKAHTGPVVLLGDFNTLSREGCRAMRSLLEEGGYTTPMQSRTATWRAGLIRLHMDWIFTRGVTVKRWGVARPLSVSDHWPVWAEIEASTDAE